MYVGWAKCLSDDIFVSEVKAKELMVTIFANRRYRTEMYIISDIDGVPDGGSASTTFTSTCTR